MRSAWRLATRLVSPALAFREHFLARLESFARDLTRHLTRVETHYARLFEDAPTLGVASGSLTTGINRIFGDV